MIDILWKLYNATPHQITSDVPQALTAIYEIGLGVIGDDWEQNFYRDGEYLLCSTCKDEAFGGICGCSAVNEVLASQRKAWALKCNIKEGETMSEGCWLWKGQMYKTGYGKFNIKNTTRRPHRGMWELFGNPIDCSKELDHLCEVRNCINPKHLEQVTRKENTARSNTVTTVNRLKTHCSNGHEFSSENTFIDVTRNWRVCRTCKSANIKAYFARRRAEKLAAKSKACGVAEK